MLTPLLVVLAIAALFLVVRKPLARVLALLLVRKAMRGALEEVGRTAIAKTADTIELRPHETYSWRSDAMERYVEPLLALGFVDAGAFAVDKMPGVHVELFVHVSEGMQASVYEHPQFGDWVEIVSRYDNG